MSEGDRAALLPPGLHDVAGWDEVERLCVRSFPVGGRRARLLRDLRDFCGYLAIFGLPFEVWIDGSFLTRKEKPNDVDVVVQVDRDGFGRLPVPQQSVWADVFLDAPSTRARWQVDAYMFFSGDSTRAAYWRRWFSHTWDGKEKGILRLMVTP